MQKMFLSKSEPKFCRNVVNIEYTAIMLFLLLFLKERKNFFARLKNKIVLYLQILNTKLYSFQNLSFRLILKIFLKFRKLSLDIFIKYIVKKMKECIARNFKLEM